MQHGEAPDVAGPAIIFSELYEGHAAADETSVAAAAVPHEPHGEHNVELAARELDDQGFRRHPVVRRGLLHLKRRVH